MMPEHHPLIGGNEVAAVLQALRRGGTHGIERQHLRRNKLAVEAKPERVHADCGHYQPHRVDLLAPAQGNGRDRQRAEATYRDPCESFNYFSHFGKLPAIPGYAVIDCNSAPPARASS